MKLACIAFASFVLLAVAACGGGGGGGSGTPTTIPSGCKATITSGFTGDVNATYPDNSGGDGGAGGDGGGGGAGAGGGEGKVLGGLMTVTRLSDGVVLGSAITDTTSGLVAIKPCSSDGALLLTLSGRSGALYYDEGTGTTVPFPEGTELHALVDQFNENVGVSVLTESAFRYALSNYFGHSGVVAAGRKAALSTGSVTGLTLAQVQSANATVLAEVNRFLPTASQLSSIKALPTPLDSTSSSTTLSVNSYGLNAVVTGALAKLAAQYFPSGSDPALLVTEQLARDFTDGKIDGFALDGSPAAAGTQALYYSSDLSQRLQAASYSISGQFGVNSTYLLGSGFSDFNYANQSDGTGCEQLIDWAALAKDGTVALNRLERPDVNAPCSTAMPLVQSFVKDFVADVQSIVGNRSSTFVVKYDGSVLAWGPQYCGRLGNGASTAITDSPTPVIGLTSVSSLGISVTSGIARDVNGLVYTWGSDDMGQLGLGDNPVYDLPFCDPGTGFSGNDGAGIHESGAITSPRQVPGLSGIVSVTAGQLTFAALGAQGDVWMWGLSPTLDPQHRLGVAATSPQLVAGLSSVVQIAGSFDNLFALKQDGTVWGRGQNTGGSLGTGDALPAVTPLQLGNLSNIAAIAANELSSAALDSSGRVYAWDGGLFRTPTLLQAISTCPVPDPSTSGCLTPLVQQNLPAIQRIKTGGDFIGLEDFNGTIYLLYPSTVGESLSDALLLRSVTSTSFGL